MKVILFCGGYGTRLREHSGVTPKPLVDIGYRPIIWHLMKYYAHFGHKDFILCLGYGGDLIKDYFLNYKEWLSNDFTLRDGGRDLQLHNTDISDWNITFVDTGLNSNIGQRLRAVRSYVDSDDMFLANYSDGLSNLPLDDQVAQFRDSEAVLSFIGVRPSQTLSGVEIGEDGIVTNVEYLHSSDIWINGGFFVVRNEVFDYMGDQEELVEEPFQKMIQDRKLLAYKYPGFWAAMDTFKDKKKFDMMYASGDTRWMIWK
ncbi:MAG: sugar phosphate nucleotidyltransferase [Thermoanaerobaculia bacterium]